MLSRPGTWLFIGVMWAFTLQKLFSLSDGWVVFIAFLAGWALNEREQRQHAKGT